MHFSLADHFVDPSAVHVRVIRRSCSLDPTMMHDRFRPSCILQWVIACASVKTLHMGHRVAKREMNRSQIDVPIVANVLALLIWDIG